jgi:hypothetical protein
MPITDAGHRARRGYRCADEAATRESENARLLHAYCGRGASVAALLDYRYHGMCLRSAGSFGERAHFSTARIRQSGPAPSLIVRSISDSDDRRRSRTDWLSSRRPRFIVAPGCGPRTLG